MDVLRYLILPMRRQLIFNDYVKKMEDELNENYIVSSSFPIKKNPYIKPNGLNCPPYRDNTYLFNWILGPPWASSKICFPIYPTKEQQAEFKKMFRKYTEFFRNKHHKDIKYLKKTKYQYIIVNYEKKPYFIKNI